MGAVACNDKSDRNAAPPTPAESAPTPAKPSAQPAGQRHRPETPRGGAARPDFKPAENKVEATDESIKANYAALDESVQRLRAQWRDKTFEQFEAEVYKEPFEGGKYIVNGDIAIADRKQLREYFDQLKAQFDDVANGKLVVNQIGHRLDPPSWPSTRSTAATMCGPARSASN